MTHKRPITLVFASVVVFSSALALGQQGANNPGNQPSAKNLQILEPDTDVADTMRAFNDALGVQCDYCHVAGDFSSDANPRKQTARKMIALVRTIEPYFPATAGVYPRGYHDVDCSTCHRGKATVETKAVPHFLNRGDAAGRIPANEKATNLKVLPPDTDVHGKGSIMEDFRDALQVDCAYCHGGGAGHWEKEDNPRKILARQMILMTRQINSQFPGTGVYPAAPSVVTCYSCHRGDARPVSLSNKNYPPVVRP